MAVPGSPSHHTNTWCPGRGARPRHETAGTSASGHQTEDGKRELRAPRAVFYPTANGKSRKPEQAGAGERAAGEGHGRLSADMGPSQPGLSVTWVSTFMQAQ